MRIQIFLVSVESFQLFRHDVDIIIVSGHNCPVIAKYRLCGPAETKLGIVTAFSGTFLEFNHNNWHAISSLRQTVYYEQSFMENIFE